MEEFYITSQEVKKKRKLKSYVEKVLESNDSDSMKKIYKLHGEGWIGVDGSGGVYIGKLDDIINKAEKEGKKIKETTPILSPLPKIKKY